MIVNANDKLVLLMRHAAPLWGPAGRLRLLDKVLRKIDRHRLPRTTTAPEKEAAEKTAAAIIDFLESDEALRNLGEIPEADIDQSLGDHVDEAPVSLAEIFKERDNPEIVITHFGRLASCLDALRSVFGKKLDVPDRNIRHRNMAYLINLTTDEVEVIEEKS